MTSLLVLTVCISLLTNSAKARNLPVDDAAKQHKTIAEFLHAHPRKAHDGVKTVEETGQ